MAEEISEKSIREAIAEHNRGTSAEIEAEKNRTKLEGEARRKSSDKKKFEKRYESGFLVVARDNLEKNISKVKSRLDTEIPLQSNVDNYNSLKRSLKEVNKAIKGIKTGAYRVKGTYIPKDGSKIEVEYEIKNRLTGRYKKGPIIEMDMRSGEKRLAWALGPHIEKYEETDVRINGGYLSTAKISHGIKDEREPQEDPVKRLIQLAYDSDTELDMKKTTFKYETKTPDGKCKTETISGYSIKPKK